MPELAGVPHIQSTSAPAIENFQFLLTCRRADDPEDPEQVQLLVSENLVNAVMEVVVGQYGIDRELFSSLPSRERQQIVNVLSLAAITPGGQG